MCGSHLAQKGTSTRVADTAHLERRGSLLQAVYRVHEGLQLRLARGGVLARLQAVLPHVRNPICSTCALLLCRDDLALRRRRGVLWA